MKRRTFIKRSLAAPTVGLGVAAGYGRFVERHAVEVVTEEIDLGLSQPLAVAVLSDIHFDPLYEADYLADVIARANQLSPDILLYAGDFLTRSAKRLAELVSILRMGKAGAGTFAVLGNHDHSVGADRVASALASADITVLRNRSVPLPGQANWYLTGLESF